MNRTPPQNLDLAGPPGFLLNVNPPSVGIPDGHLMTAHLSVKYGFGVSYLCPMRSTVRGLGVSVGTSVHENHATS